MIEVSAPGKLYIAGEYAVVEPGHPAIIVAIDQFISVSIGPAKKAEVFNLRNIATFLYDGHDAKTNWFWTSETIHFITF